MSKIKQFLEMQGQIIEYLETYDAGKNNCSVEQVYIITENCAEGMFRIMGTSGDDGDSCSDGFHESVHTEVPLDFFDNYEVHLTALQEESRATRKAKAQRMADNIREQELRNLKHLKEKYPDA